MYTDNNPLTYVNSSAKLNAVGLRWVADLAGYTFSIKYRPGKSNNDADYLSRNPTTDHFSEHTHSLSSDTVRTVLDNSSNPICACVGQLSVEELVLKPVVKSLSLSNTVLSGKQLQDPIISPV